MDLSPSDIRNRSFSQSLRGLTSDEVYAFLNEVADQWEEMTSHTQELESKVQTLKGKLDQIGKTADKVHRTKERAEKLQEEMKTKKQRLDERERELEREWGRLETTQTKLQSVVQRIQDTLVEEKQSLSALSVPDETGSQEGGQGPGEQEDAGDRSTEEWVDSLFPNRLPQSAPADDGAEDPSASGDEKAAADLSAGESQFEAIKKDVQERDATPQEASSEATEEDDEAPPTNEMEQIWDVFDQAQE